jgi:hypothetical protein
MEGLDVVGLVDSLTEAGRAVRIINTSRAREGQDHKDGKRATATLPTPYTPEALLEVVGRVTNVA